MSNDFNQNASFTSLNDNASRDVEARRHSGFCVPSILVEDWSEVNFEENLTSSRSATAALKDFVGSLCTCSRQMCPHTVLQDCKALCHTV